MRRKNLKKQKQKQKLDSGGAKRLQEIMYVIQDLIKYKKVLHIGLDAQTIEDHIAVSKNKIVKKIRRSKKNINIFLKTAKQKFDLITLINVLHHNDNPRGILKKVKTLLTQRGVVLILMPNSKSYFKIKKQVAKHSFSARTLRSALLKNGYKVKYITSFEDFDDYRKGLSIKDATSYAISILLYLTSRRFIWLLKRGGYICAIAGRS